jgi:hypothetical protein
MSAALPSLAEFYTARSAGHASARNGLPAAANPHDDWHLACAWARGFHGDCPDRDPFIDQQYVTAEEEVREGEAG